MRFILWLYVTLGNGQQCNYERVGLFADRDSLHIVSQSIDLHLKLEKRNKKHLVLSKGHKDSLHSVWLENTDSGMIIFITDLKKRETIIISSSQCVQKHIQQQSAVSMSERY